MKGWPPKGAGNIFHSNRETTLAELVIGKRGGLPVIAWIFSRTQEAKSTAETEDEGGGVRDLRRANKL